MKTIIATVALAALAGSAYGTDRVKFYDTGGSNSLDGFAADLDANGYNYPVGDYVTFCAEVVEGFSYNTEYEYGISLEVRDNGGAGPRALDSTAGRRVAYLYSEFRTNGNEAAIRALDAAFAAYTDVEIRTLMQLYVWDRFAYPDGDDWSSGQRYSDAKFDLLTAAADANGAQSSLHGVHIMNIYKVGHLGDEAFGVQDMLTMIPLPGASSLAFAGLLGVGVRRRRRA